MSGYAKDRFNPTAEELLDVLQGMADEVREGKLLAVTFSMATPDPARQRQRGRSTRGHAPDRSRSLPACSDPEGAALPAKKKALPIALVH